MEHYQRDGETGAAFEGVPQHGVVGGGAVQPDEDGSCPPAADTH